MPWKSWSTIAKIVQPFCWGHLGKLIERLWEVGKVAMVVAKMMVTNMLPKMVVAMVVVVAKSRCKAAPLLLDLPLALVEAWMACRWPWWRTSVAFILPHTCGKSLWWFGRSKRFDFVLTRTNTQMSLYQKVDSNENQNIFVSKRSKETISQYMFGKKIPRIFKYIRHTLTSKVMISRVS